MNVKKALDLLMMRLGGRTRPELRAACLLELQAFQETECEGGEELPWFLITEQAETETEVGERRIPLPPDFLREVDEGELVLISETEEEVVLEKVGYDEMEQRYANAEPGTPVVYTIRGEYIIIAPASDRVMTVRYPAYYAREEKAFDSEDSENGWFKEAPDVVLWGAGVIVATLHLKDPDLVQVMTVLLARAQQRLRNANTAREEANRERRMG